MDKQTVIHSGREDYWAIKKDKLFMLTTWVDLKYIMLSEKANPIKLHKFGVHLYNIFEMEKNVYMEETGSLVSRITFDGIIKEEHSEVSFEFWKSSVFLLWYWLHKLIHVIKLHLVIYQRKQNNKKHCLHFYLNLVKSRFDCSLLITITPMSVSQFW